MVQSIWLEFDKEQRTEENKKIIIETIKKLYKTYSYVCKESLRQDTMKFHFLDCNQIRFVEKVLDLKPLDDTKPCSCGCYSTDFETVCYFLDLEFRYGKPFKECPYDYYSLGRDVYMQIGFYHERLNILRFILECIKKEIDKKGIKSELSLSDCEKETFVDYFKGGKKNE